MAVKVPKACKKCFYISDDDVCPRCGGAMRLRVRRKSGSLRPAGSARRYVCTSCNAWTPA